MYKNTAKGLASLGRGPDTELVHMTKGELHGLQSLAQAHGGSLTINPHTGLPEAGFLSSLLPMVIGGALAATGVGAPLAAAMVAGGYGMATGSLKKGLMAGLGAYGGAGLGAGLAEAGASSLAGVAPEATAGLGATATSGTAALDAAAAPGAAASQSATQALGGNFAAAPEMATPTFGGTTAAGASTPSAFGPQTVTQMPTTPAVPQFAAAARAPITVDNLSAGLKDATSSGAKAMDFAKANSGSLMGIGASALGSMGPSQSGLPALQQQPAMIRPYTSDRVQTTPQNMIGANFVPGQNPDTSARQWFANNNQYTAGTPYLASTANNYPSMADGGQVGNGPTDSSGPVESMSNGNIMGTNTGYPMSDVYAGKYSSPDLQQPQAQNIVGAPQVSSGSPYIGQATFAGGGGISNLGGYSDGGQLLRGPGDGVSDNIPAMIGDKQHARLADGEFVVSADVVSGLGNGSTEAGSRQLYAMMDRVRKARTGTKKMGKTVDARKVVPA